MRHLLSLPRPRLGLGGWALFSMAASPGHIRRGSFPNRGKRPLDFDPAPPGSVEESPSSSPEDKEGWCLALSRHSRHSRWASKVFLPYASRALGSTLPPRGARGSGPSTSTGGPIGGGPAAGGSGVMGPVAGGPAVGPGGAGPVSDLALGFGGVAGQSCDGATASGPTTRSAV